MHVQYAAVFQVTFPDSMSAYGIRQNPQAIVMFEPTLQAVKQAEIAWAKAFAYAGEPIAAAVYAQHFEEHGLAFVQWFQRPPKTSVARRIVNACLGPITATP